MPSKAVTMGVGTQTLVTEKLNAKIKPSMISVDNVKGGQDAVLTFNDVFTTSQSNGSAPAAQVIPRLYLNIAAGTNPTTEDILKDIDFLGNVQVVIATPDANCRLTFAYSLN